MFLTNIISIFSFIEWEKPKEWLDYERQRSQTATSNKIPDGGGGLRGQSQNQSQRLLKMPSNRDRGRNDIDYDDTDSRGSMNNRGSDNRGHRGQDHDLDPRLLRDQREDMEISSSHDTTPTSDESHPRGHGGHSSSAGDRHHSRDQAAVVNCVAAAPSSSAPSSDHRRRMACSANHSKGSGSGLGHGLIVGQPAWLQRKIHLRPQHRGVHLVTEEILRQVNI